MDHSIQGNYMANPKIPIWINIVQGLLILIMLQQTYMFFLDPQTIAASGIMAEGIPNLNLLYKFGARTATMALLSIIVMITQNPRYFLVILLMNLFREGLETIVDALYPLANAPVSPSIDFIMHIVIIAIELWAFITMYKIVRQMDEKVAEG